MSTLSRKLESFRTTHGLTNTSSRRVSLLFDKRDIARLDRAQIIQLGVTGYNDLVSSSNGEFSKFAGLFGSNPKSRDFMNLTEVNSLDSLIRSFCQVSTEYFLRNECLACIEYMIQIYAANIYNIDSLLLMALPYHDKSDHFVKLVRTLPELKKNPRWFFLEPLRSSASLSDKDGSINWVTMNVIVKAAGGSSSSAAAIVQCLVDNAVECIQRKTCGKFQIGFFMNFFVSLISLKSFNSSLSFSILPLINIALNLEISYFLGTTLLKLFLVLNLRGASEVRKYLVALKDKAIRNAPEDKRAEIMEILNGERKNKLVVIETVVQASPIVQETLEEISRSESESEAEDGIVVKARNFSDENSSLQEMVDQKRKEEKRARRVDEVRQEISRYFHSTDDDGYKILWSTIMEPLVSSETENELITQFSRKLKNLEIGTQFSPELKSLLIIFVERFSGKFVLSESQLIFSLVRLMEVTETSENSRKIMKVIMKNIVEDFLFSKILEHGNLYDLISRLIRAGDEDETTCRMILRFLGKASEFARGPISIEGERRKDLIEQIVNNENESSWKFIQKIMNMEIVTFSEREAGNFLQKICRKLECDENNESFLGVLNLLLEISGKSSILPLFKSLMDLLVYKNQTTETANSVKTMRNSCLLKMSKKMGEFFANEKILFKLIGEIENEEIMEILKSIFQKIDLSFSLKFLSEDNENVNLNLRLNLLRESLKRKDEDFEISMSQSNMVKQFIFSLASDKSIESELVGVISDYSTLLSLSDLFDFFKNICTSYPVSLSLKSFREIVRVGGSTAVTALIQLVADKICNSLLSATGNSKSKIVRKRARECIVVDEMVGVEEIALLAIQSILEVSSEIDSPSSLYQEFLDSSLNFLLSNSSASSASLFRVSAVIVSLAKQFAGNECTEILKSLVGDICRGFRTGRNVAIKRSCLKILKNLWKELGHSMTVTASETLLLATEIIDAGGNSALQDEEEDTADDEEIAKMLVKEIEGLTGEKLNELITASSNERKQKGNKKARLD